jgi:hypothetical protein
MGSEGENYWGGDEYLFMSIRSRLPSFGAKTGLFSG